MKESNIKNLESKTEEIEGFSRDKIKSLKQEQDNEIEITRKDY